MIGSISQAAYALTVAAAAIACAAALVTVVWRHALTIGRFANAIAAASGLTALVTRSIVSGHLPIFGTFENTLTAAWAIMATAAFFSWRFPVAREVWRWAAPWALALLLFGTRFRAEPVPLTISEQSLWVDAHVLFAWVAFVALVGASTLAILRLAGRSPFALAAEDADDLLGRLVLLGFLGLTVMLALGSLYLYVLFAVFWRWEVVETLSLLAWLGYGMIAHARLFYRMGGRRLALAVVAVLPLLLLAFWIWSVFPGTFHFFDIPLVRSY